MQPTAVSTAPAAPHSERLIPLAMALFFAFGFCTVLVDTLTPLLRGLFALNYFETTFTPFVFFLAYFIISMPAAWLLARIGYLPSIIIGLVLTAIGCCLFTPAARLGSYEAFLGAVFVMASGVTIVQVAANPLAALVGDPRFSHSRLTLAQAFNSVATMIGPLVGARLILSHLKPMPKAASLTPQALNQLRILEAHSVQAPFLFIALGLVLLAGVCALFLAQSPPPAAKAHGTYRKLLASPRLMLGVVSIFTYVGAEVAIGGLLTNYLMSSHALGLPVAKAGQLVSVYWGLAMVGRFIGSVALRLFKPGAVLTLCALGAAVLASTSALSGGMVAAAAILGIGLFNSIMFPTIFTLAIDGLGEAAPQGSGLLCLAIVGGAVVPLISGRVADSFGLTAFLIVPIVCYLWIAFYGLFTQRPALAASAALALGEAA